jgi:hypothetical protein
MQKFLLRRLAPSTALLVGALLFAAGSAGAATISWSVPLSGQAVINSGLPADAAATGQANITGDDSNNRMCGTFTWSNVHSPMGFGHIHEGEAGQPENPAVTISFFGPPTNLNGFQSGVTGCAVVPNALIDKMDRYGAFFNVVLHTAQYPGGALRGQLGCGTLLFNWQCGGF